MFRRFRDGLVYPRELLQYRKDKMVYVILYILFFAVLYSTTTIIYVATFDGLSISERESIINDFNKVNTVCQTDDSMLTCDLEDSVLFYQGVYMNFYIDSNVEYNASIYSDDLVSIVAHDENMLVYLSGVEVLVYPIASLPDSFHNLDFEEQSSNPNLLYARILDGVDDVLIQTSFYWGIFTILSEVMVSMVFYLLFVLMSAYFMKKRFQIIPFKHLFVLTTYASASLFVILIFDSIINLDLILIIVLLILAFRQNNQLSREIERRLRNKS